MGLRSSQFVSTGGGGGNQIATTNLVPAQQPLAGDFCIVIIQWQCGLPLGGYVPVQPAFKVQDLGGGNNWVNVGDVFDSSGPGTAFASQASLSVWICRNANGQPMNLQISGSAVPLIQDQQGGFVFQDWQLTTHGADILTAKVDNTNTASPSQGAVNIGDLNQLIIAAFFAPYGVAPVLSSSSAGYTVMNGFGSGSSRYLDEYKVRPIPGVAQAPGIVTTAAEATWLMASVLIDINPPTLKVNQILFPGKLKPLGIER